MEVSAGAPIALSSDKVEVLMGTSHEREQSCVRAAGFLVAHTAVVDPNELGKGWEDW